MTGFILKQTTELVMKTESLRIHVRAYLRSLKSRWNSADWVSI